MSLTPKMQAALTQYSEQGHMDGVHPNTVRALERRGLVVGETLGAPRPSRYAIRWRNEMYNFFPTRDAGQPDYEFWSKAFRGQVAGLEIAGLFLKPIVSKIAAWALGMPPKIGVKRPRTQELVTDWLAKNYAHILRAYEEAVKLGDAYLVVNPPDERGDLTLTVVPPTVVEPLVDEDDYSRVIGRKIVEVYPHPTRTADRMTIVDEYTAQGRERRKYKNGVLVERQNYKNLIGRIPVIHIAFDRGSDEQYGHAVGEALVRGLQKYGEIFESAIIGNKKQGRPTPTFERMGTQKQIDALFQTFGKKESRELPDGTTETYMVLDLSGDDVIVVGGDGTFSYKQPGSFTKDTEVLLGLLFYLFLQHTEIPEFIWGNAIQGSKASAETQVEPFAKFIDKLRGEIDFWFIELLLVVIGYLALWERGVAADEHVAVKWPALTNEDSALTLEAIKFGRQDGLLDRETALTLMPLDIDDPREVLAKVDAEIEQSRLEYEQRASDLIASQVDDDEQDMEPTGEMVGVWLAEQAKQKHTGVMVGFFLDRDTGEQLHAAVGDVGVPTPPEDFHLTLAYLGNSREINATEEELREVLKQFAGSEFGLEAKLSGVGRFDTDEGNGTNAVYASVDSPDLPYFRQALVEALGEAGIEYAKNHGFTPHITLAYVAAEDETPAIDLPDVTLDLGRLTLAWGDKRTEFELKGQPVTP